MTASDVSRPISPRPFVPAPTPLERLDNLTKASGGPRARARDFDQAQRRTVVATGSNKRKLEWLIDEARA
jgi:hypothetical protein